MWLLRNQPTRKNVTPVKNVTVNGSLDHGVHVARNVVEVCVHERYCALRTDNRLRPNIVEKMQSLLQPANVNIIEIFVYPYTYIGVHENINKTMKINHISQLGNKDPCVDDDIIPVDTTAKPIEEDDEGDEYCDDDEELELILVSQFLQTILTYFSNDPIIFFFAMPSIQLEFDA